jgi:hypothetical protein
MTEDKKNLNGENGLIKFGVKILIAILILSFFGFSIRDLVESDTTQDNFGYLGELFREYVIPFYNTYLSAVVDFIISFIKDSFVIFQEYINNPSELPLDVPEVKR